MKNFDDNNIDRLQALASLKRRCLHWEYMAKGLMLGSTFFSDLSDEIDIPLLFIMNDELTNSNHRSGISQLIESFVSENKYYNYIEISNGDNNTDLLLEDLRKCFVSDADDLLHRVLTRFFINAFSVFEFWVCKTYESVKLANPTGSKRLIKLEKRLCIYVGLINEGKLEEAEKLKNLIFKDTNSYISSREKIDFIISKISYTGLSDEKLKKDAIDLIHFLFPLRNTIHNIGVNKSGKDFKLEINNTVVYLENDCAPKYEHYAKFIDSFHLLIDFYSDLFMYAGENLSDFNEIVTG